MPKYTEKLKEVEASQFNWPKDKAVEANSKFLGLPVKYTPSRGAHVAVPVSTGPAALVSDGDWVVTTTNRGVVVMSNEAFVASYEAVKQAPYSKSK